MEQKTWQLRKKIKKNYMTKSKFSLNNLKLFIKSIFGLRLYNNIIFKYIISFYQPHVVVAVTLS